MKKFILGALAIILLILCCIAIAYCHRENVRQQEYIAYEQQLLFEQEIGDIALPQEWYIADGYDNFTDWWNDTIAQKESLATIASEIISEHKNYLTEQDIAALEEISARIQASHSQAEMTALTLEAEKIEAKAIEAKEAAVAAAAAKKAQQAQPASYSSSGGNGNNFKSQGVIYANGYRYTWYSSRVLYHYRTPEWTAGADGIYRDSNGYVIVASSDHSQGTIVPTPFGSGIVRDSGCPSGTLDIYTNF